MSGAFVLKIEYGALATVIVESLYAMCRALISHTVNPYPALLVFSAAAVVWVVIDQHEYEQRCRMATGSAARHRGAGAS